MYDILIIDDDVVDRRIARDALSGGSLAREVHEAQSGTEGLALVSRKRYDCILLDLQLPDMDGIEVLRELEKLEGEHRPAVVMLTGAGSERAAVKAMRLGAQDYLVKSELTARETVGAVLRAMESHRTDVARDAENSRLVEMALVDGLTGLGNRNHMEARLERAVRRARRGGGPFCVLLLDLDGFKGINDTHGHLAGDHVLTVVGERLQEVSRVSDAVARLGGDEFVVVMETGVTPEGAQTFAERIRETVETPIAWESTTLRVGCSLGAAITHDGHETADDLLRAADEAMYAEKRRRHGKDRDGAPAEVHRKTG